MSKMLMLSDFSPTVGSAFQVRTESDVALQLELLEAVGQNRRVSGGRESFSLLFKGPSDTLLRQQIHFLNHAELGELSIFLVPIGRKADGIHYEAIFN